MFTNIAGKLKGLAVVQTIIFIAFGIIIWTLPYQTGGFVPKSEAGLFVIIGIIIMLAGWIGQWLLYAFGQLVENTDQINRNLAALLAMQMKQASSGAAAKTSGGPESHRNNASATTPKSNYYRDFSKFDNSSIGWVCEYCGSKNSSDSTKCKICSKSRHESDYKNSKR